MVLTVSIVGLHESGKTTILEELIQRLEPNLRVGSIKHSQKPIEIDKEGSDSWRHRKAGTSVTCLSSQNQFVLFHNLDRELPLKKILYLMERADPKLDLVLIEGYKKEDVPKIIITQSEDFLHEFKSEEICAVVNDDEFESGYPQYKRDDIEGLQALIQKRFEKSASRYSSHKRMRVVLRIDDKQVPINRFVADIFGNTINAITMTLKGIGSIRKVVIRASYNRFKLITKDDNPNVIVELLVNGSVIHLSEFVQHVYANIITSFLTTIKIETTPKTVELSMEWTGT